MLTAIAASSVPEHRQPGRRHVAVACRGSLGAAPAHAHGRASPCSNAPAWARSRSPRSIGFVVYPTYPNYDSYYSLLWGRELVGLDALSFEAYRAPTEHPLAIAFGALLTPLGDGADRVMVACAVLSFLALVAAVYALGKTAFTPLVGAVAAALLVTRFDFPFLAARGYIDIPYLAVVVWAAVIELRAPRRHPVVVLGAARRGRAHAPGGLAAGGRLLAVARAAGELEPARRCTPRWRRSGRSSGSASTSPSPANPLYSLTGTRDLAEELGRNKGGAAVPAALYAFLVKLAKFPVVIAGMAGVVLAVVLTPRRALMPLVLFAIGAGTFALVGLAGLSVIDRYLLVPSLCVMIFAAVFIAGWTMLERGTRWRRAVGDGRAGDRRLRRRLHGDAR